MEKVDIPEWVLKCIDFTQALFLYRTCCIGNVRADLWCNALCPLELEQVNNAKQEILSATIRQQEWLDKSIIMPNHY